MRRPLQPGDVVGSTTVRILSEFCAASDNEQAEFTVQVVCRSPMRTSPVDRPFSMSIFPRQIPRKEVREHVSKFFDHWSGEIELQKLLARDFSAWLA